MKPLALVCVVALACACKREEDASPVQTTTASSSAPAQTSTGPTQLVALTQPADSVASASPALTPTFTATSTPTSSQLTANARAPSVVVGNAVANGLPAETVQRVMRQNVGRYRQCYETGLRGNPALHGRVMVRMTIDASGSISSAEDAGSDLADDTVTSCVFGTLGTLTFPQPAAGSATATVPIVFSPTP
jgi:hypothetical protein